MWHPPLISLHRKNCVQSVIKIIRYGMRVIHTPQKGIAKTAHEKMKPFEANSFPNCSSTPSQVERERPDKIYDFRWRVSAECFLSSGKPRGIRAGCKWFFSSSVFFFLLEEFIGIAPLGERKTPRGGPRKNFSFIYSHKGISNMNPFGASNLFLLQQLVTINQFERSNMDNFQTRRSKESARPHPVGSQFKRLTRPSSQCYIKIIIL